MTRRAELARKPPGTVRYMDLHEAAARYRLAVEVRDQARAQLADAVRAAVADGESEAHAATVAGVSRMTVRDWCGKPRPPRR